MRTLNKMAPRAAAFSGKAAAAPKASSEQKVVYVDGYRTPFKASQTTYNDLLAVDLSRMVLKGLMDKTMLDAKEVDYSELLLLLFSTLLLRLLWLLLLELELELELLLCSLLRSDHAPSPPSVLASLRRTSLVGQRHPGGNHLQHRSRGGHQRWHSEQRSGQHHRPGLHLEQPGDLRWSGEDPGWKG